MSCNNHIRMANTGSNIMLKQSVFSVEKISKEEYIQAYNTSADYNIYPQQVDSSSQQDVLNGIFQNAKERIAALDSVERCAIYEAVTNDELYCIDNLLYYPDLNLLGFKVPLDYHNNTVWWYDSTIGKPMNETLFEPTAVNSNGIYVCQALADCDIRLNLHFFKKQWDTIYKIQAYLNQDYSGEYFLLMSDDEQYKRIFWHKNNMLYLCSYNLHECETVFLKISLGFDI